jgi:hypothetical protein
LERLRVRLFQLLRLDEQGLIPLLVPPDEAISCGVVAHERHAAADAR